jgi:hypothetical protein
MTSRSNQGAADEAAVPMPAGRALSGLVERRGTAYGAHEIAPTVYHVPGSASPQQLPRGAAAIAALECVVSRTTFHSSDRTAA